MSAQYTPGPWVAGPADMFGDHNISRADGLEVAAIAAVVSNLRDADEVAENARIIAKAPAMYELLEWIAAFADIRSQDDSKVFARVNRGALRTIRDKARAALSLAIDGDGK